MHLLSLQTVIFSLPALALGITVMLMLLTAIKAGVYYMLNFPINAHADWYTITLAVILGLVVPQLSNLGPIRDLTGASLRD